MGIMNYTRKYDVNILKYVTKEDGVRFLFESGYRQMPDVTYKGEPHERYTLYKKLDDVYIGLPYISPGGQYRETAWHTILYSEKGWLDIGSFLDNESKPSFNYWPHKRDLAPEPPLIILYAWPDGNWMGHIYSTLYHTVDGDLIQDGEWIDRSDFDLTYEECNGMSPIDGTEDILDEMHEKYGPSLFLPWDADVDDETGRIYEIPPSFQDAGIEEPWTIWYVWPRGECIFQVADDLWCMNENGDAKWIAKTDGKGSNIKKAIRHGQKWYNKRVKPKKG